MAKNIQGIINGAEKQGERIRHRWGLRERVVWNCVYINSSGSEKSSLVSLFFRYFDIENKYYFSFVGYQNKNKKTTHREQRGKSNLV